MEKSLFKNEGRFFKANLHNHTTISDGQNTPEEIKQYYMAQRYNIVAYSDHDIMVPHPELTDENFLALTAFEYEFAEKKDPENPWTPFDRCYHTVVIAPVENCTYYPWANPDYAWGNARKYIQDYYKGSYSHEYDVENINNLIKDAHEHGFIVTYCHPHWSLQTYPDYCGIEDVDFVETYNSGSYLGGWSKDASEQVYDDFLCLGKHCYPTASDDGHSPKDYCWGATYIKAPALEYGTIIDAMKQGDVYASWGPEIYDITYDPESKKVAVECSAAREIFFNTERRYAKRFFKENGAQVYRAEFDIADYIDETIRYHKESTAVFHLTVVDEGGRKALSRGYFVDELLSL